MATENRNAEYLGAMLNTTVGAFPLFLGLTLNPELNFSTPTELVADGLMIAGVYLITRSIFVGLGYTKALKLNPW